MGGQRDPDRVLAPVAVASALSVKVKVLAGWMRSAGVTTPLTVKEARRWRANPHTAPGWLAPKLLEHYRRRSERAERERQERSRKWSQEWSQEVDDAYLVIVDLLRRRDRKLYQGRWLDRHPAHALALEDIAWRAAKDCGLARGQPADFSILSFEEREALRICGFDVPEPSEHRRPSLRIVGEA